MLLIKGVDVSKWQGMIDWARAKDQIDFAVIRAGSGSNTDVYALTNAKQCEHVKLPYGLYWYSYTTTESEARKEAERLIDFVRNNALKPEYPLVFDFEYDSAENVKKAGHNYSPDYLRSLAYAFCEEIEKSGFYAMIYSNKDFLENWYGKEIFKRFDLWYARWDKQSQDYPCGIWQYTCKGKVKGIATQVDMDISNKDYPSIMRKAHLNGF